MQIGGRQNGSSIKSRALRGPLDRWPLALVVIVLGGLTAAFIVALYMMILRHEEAERDDAMLRTATLGAENFNHLRAFYTDSLFMPFDDGTGENLPLPATFSIEFGEYLSSHESSMSMALYSELPFPWRDGRTLDPFQTEALDALSEGQDSTYYRFFGEGEERIVRLAVPVTMGEKCVACHNAHPQSPFVGWSPGDVRGIQEVTVRNDSLSADPAAGHATFRDIMIFVSSCLILAFCSIGVLLWRNKAAFESLRQSEEQATKLSMVAAATDNAVILTDAEGRIEWVNDGFTRLSGYTLDEVVNRSPGEVLQADDANPQARLRMAQAVRDGRPFAEEILNYTRDGKPYWVEIEAQPIRDADGRVTQFMAIERDVTSPKEQRRSLENAIKVAQEANAAKSRFLAMMSHEVRTPLNGVLGGLNLLGDQKLDVRGRQLVDLTVRAAESLLSIINDILDYSKMEAGKLDLQEVTFDPADVVAGVKEILGEKAAGKGLELLVDVEHDLPPALLGDPSRLRQVLLNLTGNAVKFTESGSVIIRVTASAPEDDGVELTFAVIDTGPGIPQEEIANLFDEFWTQRRQITDHDAGSGLGLAITRTLVNLMGGSLNVESEVGVGSCFAVQIRLPLAQQVSATGVNGNATAGSADTTALSGRLLVVEDNLTNQLVIRAMLERLGLHPHVVSSGAEALDAVKNDTFDLVLMDIGMPDMDGVETTKRIRQMGLDSTTLPVIAVSAFVMDGDRDDFLARGLDDYISKPIDSGVLESTLRFWLTGAPARQQKPVSLEPPAPDHAFDPVMMEELAEILSDSALAKVVETFRCEAKDRLRDISEAAVRGDLAAIARQAHPLKSSAASLGAMSVAEIARILEEDGRRGDDKSIDELIAGLGEAMEACNVSLAEWIDGRQAPDGGEYRTG